MVHAWTQVWPLVEHLGTDFTLQLWREGEGTFGTWEFKSPFSDPSQGNCIENHQQTPPKEWSMSSANVWSSSLGTTKQINNQSWKKNLLSMIARAHRRGRTPIRAIRSLLWELRVQAMKWSSSAPTLIQIISLVIIININMLSAPSRDGRHQQIGGFGHSG